MQISRLFPYGNRGGKNEEDYSLPAVLSGTELSKVDFALLKKLIICVFLSEYTSRNRVKIIHEHSSSRAFYVFWVFWKWVPQM